MLLCEIIATKYELPKGSKQKYGFDIDWGKTHNDCHMSAITKTIHWNQEEVLDMYDLNIDPDTLPQKVSIVYAYTFPSANNQHNRMIKDALKDRDPHNPSDPSSYMNPKDRTQFLWNAVEKLQDGEATKNATQLKGHKITTLGPIRRVSDILSGKIHATILPLGSSKKVTSEFADIIAQATGYPIISQAYIKQAPQQSATIGNHGNYEKRLNQLDPTGRINKIKQRAADAETEFKRLMKVDTDGMTRFQYKTHMTRMETTKQKMNDLAEKAQAAYTEIKNLGAGQRDRAFGFMNTQKLHPDIPKSVFQALNGKVVLLVDDNVVNASSIMDALKQLYKAGIVPSEVIGICAHKM